MKINKKVIIVVLVVAVFLWLFLRKRNASSETVPVDPTETKDLNYILERVTFDANERKSIKSVYNSAANDIDYKQDLLAKAANNGVNYYQQVAMDGLYLIFVKKGNAYQNRYDNLLQKIKNL